MLAEFKKEIAEAIGQVIKDDYGVDDVDIVLEVPPQRKFGDLACPVAFNLAKALGRNPHVIANEIVQKLAEHYGPRGVHALKTAGAGYINIFLRRFNLIYRLYEALKEGARLKEDQGKAVVEHTNINPNKAAHIGHLRNAVLGDTLVRVLADVGYAVEVQNYIDDTGVQVADVVVAFTEIEKKTLEEIEAIKGRFDYYCWDLYAKVGRWYEEDSRRLEIRQRTLHEMEKGDTEAARIAACVSKRIVEAHIATMDRLGIAYDLLPWESGILAEGFWQAAFDKLKKAGAIRLEAEGRNKGCWVMALSDSEEFEEMDEPDKILVRSNGTVTYTGKDIAYQLWKFGLLGRDFHYRLWKTYEDGRELWTTTPGDGVADHPAFGKGDRVYNVIDVRQSYPQKVVKHALGALGYAEEAEQSIHFAYEMVALSQAAARVLGVAAGEGETVEISGRKGVGVKADDLLDAVFERAVAAVAEEKSGDMDGVEREGIARMVALAAVRYFMIKYGRARVIAFDFDDALNLRGETGPYLLYSYVRFGSIFRKLEAAGLWNEGEDAVDDFWRKMLRETGKSDEEDPFNVLELEDWDLVIEVAKLEDVLELALAELELSSIAKFAFNVAQKANSFYHRCHILSEKDPVRQRVLIATSYVFRRALARLLGLMGIKTLGRM